MRSDIRKKTIFNNFIRPREYAANILKLTTREERKAALDKVPEELKQWVELYVRNEFERRKYSRRA